MSSQIVGLSIKEGDLLVAPPAVKQGPWHESVIMIGIHDEGGTQGWVINRPTGHKMTDVLKESESELRFSPYLDIDLYWGGPVQPHTVWLLHSPEWEMSNTRQINEHWSVTSNEQMFHHLADMDVPRYFKAIVGYSGWMPGQLFEELQGEPPRLHRNSWLTVKDPDPEELLSDHPTQLWNDAVNWSIKQSVDSTL